MTNDQLIIVSGLYYGMLLCEVDRFPLHEFIRNKIVYTSHAYSWFSLRYVVRSFIEVYLITLIIFTLLAWACVFIIALIYRKYPD